MIDMGTGSLARTHVVLVIGEQARKLGSAVGAYENSKLPYDPGRLFVPLRTRIVVVMFWKAVQQNDVERALGSESAMFSFSSKC